MTRIATAPWAGVFRFLLVAAIIIVLAVSDWSTSLWRNGLVLIPLAALVAVVARRSSVSPTTRHTLWLALLLWLVVGVALPPVFLIDSEEGVARSLAGAASRGPDGRTGDSIASPPSWGSGDHSIPGISESDLPQIESVTSRPDRSIIVLGTVRPFTTTSIDYSTKEDYKRKSRDGTLTDDATDSMTEPPDSEPNESQWRSPSICDADLVATAIGPESTSFDPPDHQAAGITARGGLTRIEARRISGASPGSGELGSPSWTSDVSGHPRIESWFDEMIPGLGRYVEFVLAPKFRAWNRPLAMAWESLTRLPAMPLPIWIAGILVVFALRTHRGRVFRRIVDRGVDAPADVRRCVEQAARAMGLSDIPRTIVVEDRITPMIWFEGPATLILPIRLWRELDQTARRAVLCHELAHLRRRDHWINRIESWIGAVYWWHPLVWWIRGRLQEEAEHCCDAWVTWLQPGGRRAYAEALIQTKQFINPPDAPSPVGAIGMTSGRTRRFARRLTMVMTQRVSPNLSRIHLISAVGVIAIGWLLSPDPSNMSQAAEQVTKPLTATEPPVAPLPSMPAPVAPAPSAPSTPMARSTFSSTADESNADLAARVARLDQQLERLSNLLEVRNQAVPNRIAPTTATGLPPAGQVRIPGPSVAVTAPLPVVEPTNVIVSTEDTVYGREYPIPTGRREALWNLMALADVPPCVVESPNGITLNGTAAQHRAFAAFVELITASSENRVGSYQLPESKMAAMKALMIRSDVPVLVDVGGDVLRVHGNEVTQRIVADFIELIHPTKAPSIAGDQPGKSLFGVTAPMAGRGSISQPARPNDENQAVHAFQVAQTAALLEREAHSRSNYEQALERANRAKAAAEEEMLRAKVLREFTASDNLESQVNGYAAMARLLQERVQTLRALLAQQKGGLETESAIEELTAIENRATDIERASQVLREMVEEIRRNGEMTPSQSEQSRDDRESGE